MANNRMDLVNKRTGQRVRLAKYFPSTGWTTSVSALADFTKAFGVDAFEDSPGTMYGDEWALEYEEVSE